MPACGAGQSERQRHRTLIDVIQDLEQENAAEVASSGVSPASDRPVPLDLSCSISGSLAPQQGEGHTITIRKRKVYGFRRHKGSL